MEEGTIMVHEWIDSDDHDKRARSHSPVCIVVLCIKRHLMVLTLSTDKKGHDEQERTQSGFGGSVELIFYKKKKFIFMGHFG